MNQTRVLAFRTIFLMTKYLICAIHILPQEHKFTSFLLLPFVYLWLI